MLENEAGDVRLRVVVGDQAGRNGFFSVVYAMAKRFAKHGRRFGEEITLQANPRLVVPMQVADLIAWETTYYRLQRPPRPEYARLRRLGQFKIGQPPRMFEGWGPPSSEELILCLEELASEPGAETGGA